MQEKDFRVLGIKTVVDYFNSQAESTDKNGHITEDDVFIVWSCKTLQNNKMLLSTTVPDGMYYEFTWNGDKQEGYLDCYKKWKNIVVKEEEVELATCISYKNSRGEIINANHDAIGNCALAFDGTSGVQIGWLASQADMLGKDWEVK